MPGLFRACWIDQGNGPDYAKFAANAITWPYFDIRDPRLTPAYLDGVIAHAGIDGAGVYVAWNWPELAGKTPAQVADWIDLRLRAIGWLGNPPVCFDAETDNTGYVAETLRVFRVLRPKRTIDYTLEGHKGGIWSGAVVARQIVSAVCRYVVPQCYNGAMTQTWDTYAMTADLVSAGFPFAELRPFYDAAHLPVWWSGYAFSQGRLP